MVHPLEIMEIGPSDIKRAESRINRYIWVESPGMRCILRIYIKDMIDLVLAAGSTSLIVEAMKAVPVSVPIGDIYEGLQRGMIASHASKSTTFG